MTMQSAQPSQAMPRSQELPSQPQAIPMQSMLEEDPTGLVLAIALATEVEQNAKPLMPRLLLSCVGDQ
jgi:hypothetical protein